MDDILLNIEACTKSEPDPQMINSILFQLQTNLNRIFFQSFSEEDLIKFLVKIRDFIFLAASNTNSSIRISAYRTTCMILMKLTPFLPTILQKVFIESVPDSEINEKNSQIVIAAFSFLSQFIAPPLLQVFISQTNYIFNYFTTVDNSFSDHLAPIVKNLSHLGNLWLKQLLLSFMEKGVKATDRHIILAISEIVKHDPVYFFKELIFHLTNHGQIREHLPLLSFLFTTIQCNYQTLDFGEILTVSVEILSNLKNSTATEIDSALQILSLGSTPFVLSIRQNSENGETIKNALNVYINTKNDHFNFLLDITELIDRPSFYLLPLPISFLYPLPTDGILQLSSKFRSLSRIVNDLSTSDETRILIFNKFKFILSQSYNDMTSACMTNFALSIPSFLQLTERYKVMNLIREIIFTKPTSWFHSCDIVCIINEIPFAYFDMMVDKDDQNFSIQKTEKFDLKKVLKMLIDFSSNSNEKLAQSSRELIAKLVSNTDFINCLSFLSKQIDYFDLDSLLNHLSIFIHIFDYRKIEKSARYLRKELSNINMMIFPLIESLSFFQNPELSIEIIHFLSYFDLRLLNNDDLLAKLFCDCETIISLSINYVCGTTAFFKPIFLSNNQYDSFISSEITNCIYEEVPEYGIDYSRYMPSFSRALALINNYPHGLLKQSKIFEVFSCSIHFFQAFAATFINKYWMINLDTKMKLKLLSYARPHLPHLHDRKTIAIFCNLFLSFVNCLPKDTSNSKINKFKISIHELTSKMLDTANFFPEYFALEIFVNDNIDHLSIENLSHAHQLELFRLLLSFDDNLNLLQKVGNSRFNKIINEIPVEVALRQQKVENFKRKKGIASLSRLKNKETKKNTDYKLPDLLNSPLSIITPNFLTFNNSSTSTSIEADSSSTTNDGINTSQSVHQGIKLPTIDPNEISESIRNTFNNVPLIHRSSSADIALELKYKNDMSDDSKLSRIDTTTDTELDEKSTVSVSEAFLKYDVSKEKLYLNLIDSDISNCLIKTQLKMNLVVFSTEQIHKLIRFYIGSNDLEGLDLIFQYLLKNHAEVSIAEYEFPINSIRIVFEYLQKINSNELTNFIDNYSYISEIKILKFISNPKSLLDDSLHLTKPQLGELAHYFSNIDADILVPFLMKELREIKKKNRLNLVLLIANLICSFCSIDSDTIKEITSIISSKYNILMHPLFAQLIMTISMNLNKDQDIEFFAKFIRRSYEQFQGRLSGLLVLHRALLALPSTTKKENISNFVSPYLASDIPSLFCSGLRVFHQGLISLKEDDVLSLIKSHLQKTMEMFNFHNNTFPISEISCEIFSLILSNDLFFNDLIKYTIDLTPQNDRAIFHGLGSCLPLIILRYPNNQDEVWKKIEIRSDLLITKPMNLFMLKIYMQCLKNRYSKITNSRIKDTFITDFVTSWMRNLEYFDCYDMSSIFYEWEQLIYNVHGIEQLLPFVCYQFFKYIPRFFPLFVSMSKFFNEIIGKEDKTQIQMFLNNSALLNPVKAHALSTVLAINKQYIKEALQLASFPIDCEESNRIIECNHVFQELLNDIYANK